MVVRILWLALAGSAGTLARYGLQGWVQRLNGPGFPWGTLAVNVLGCFLFGLVWSLSADRGLIGPQVRSVLLIGFMGAFTTFSSYVFETTQLMAARQWALAAGNFGMENLLGFLGLWGGVALCRAL